jgi:hypothetical protein
MFAIAFHLILRKTALAPTSKGETPPPQQINKCAALPETDKKRGCPLFYRAVLRY